jgi:hypothetical protein
MRAFELNELSTIMTCIFYVTSYSFIKAVMKL